MKEKKMSKKLNLEGVTSIIGDHREKLDSKELNDLAKERLTGFTSTISKKHQEHRVLVIYTGGTIGSAPMDREDPESPQIVVSWNELRKDIPELDKFGFPIDAISFEEPLDSANVGPTHWAKISRIIKELYDDYVGFVVAHGTDTMVYTASALSFMLKSLSKPVIITGSQISGIDKMRNDARQNLITALLYANPEYSKITPVREVCIFFRDSLLRGNRAKKIDASGYSAFDTPNFPHLGKAGDNLGMNTNIISQKEKPHESFRVQPVLGNEVIVLDVFPGMQDNSKMFRNVLSTPQLRGVILKTYGAGNVPTEPKAFVEEIKKANDEKNIIFVNVTQCLRGDVEQGLYDTSAVLEDVGVINGQEMTAEAALCKLMELLKDPANLDDEGEPNNNKIKSLMTRNIAGEINNSIYYTTLIKKSQQLSFENNESVSLPARDIKGRSREGEIEKVLISFKNAKILNTQKLKIKIYLYGELVEKWLVGEFTKQKTKTAKSFVFNITTRTKIELAGHSDVFFTIKIEDIEGDKLGSFEWDVVTLSLFVKEDF